MNFMIKKIFDNIYNKLLLKKHRVKYGANLKINGRLLLCGTGDLIIGDNVTINSSFESNPTGGGNRTCISVKKNARLIIGNNVGISNSTIAVIESVTIEDDVRIGSSCMIADNDFHSIIYEERMHKPGIGTKSAQVTIRKGAFVGARSIILKGSVVGEKSVIGAGSVVTKKIPDNEIWARNPAKFVRTIKS